MGASNGRRSVRPRATGRLGKRCYFITVGTAEAEPYFGNAEIAEFVVGKIIDFFPARKIEVCAYCLMPDHLHLFCRCDGSIDIETAVTRFKQRVGSHLRRAFGISVWQERFYDLVLNSPDDSEAMVKYVLEDPLRMGLVDNLEDYPYSGSPVKEL